jgi:hypothetical protein
MAECKIPEHLAKVESQNATQWAHWTAYHRYNKKWRSALALRLGRSPDVVTTPMDITITSYRSRLLDKGNLVGGCKPIPDALKALGWIKDDSPEWVDIHYDQIKTKKNQTRGTHITVQPKGTP